MSADPRPLFIARVSGNNKVSLFTFGSEEALCHTQELQSISLPVGTGPGELSHRWTLSSSRLLFWRLVTIRSHTWEKLVASYNLDSCGPESFNTKQEPRLTWQGSPTHPRNITQKFYRLKFLFTVERPCRPSEPWARRRRKYHRHGHTWFAVLVPSCLLFTLASVFYTDTWCWAVWDILSEWPFSMGPAAHQISYLAFSTVCELRKTCIHFQLCLFSKSLSRAVLTCICDSL